LGIRRVAERLHRQEPFELIHAHFIYPDAVVGGQLATRWDIPLVVTEHAPWNGWLERPGVCGPALATARLASRLIAVSSSVRDSIVSYTGDPAKVTVVPNGVDPTEYRLGPFEARDPEQILYVGLINRNKGIDVLLEAMRIIARERPAAKLLLVGGSFYRNTRLQREALEQSADDLVQNGRVRFLGHLPPGDVADLMARSAVVVLPSRAESFGSVLVEALACGTPVVATRCGGPEDIVDDTVGKLVPTEDPVALAHALLDVLRRRDTYDPETLRGYALSRFSWDSVVAKTLQVYREVTTP
jgi:glycosyltransferase involved in cell wall biosynthesis